MGTRVRTVTSLRGETGAIAIVVALSLVALLGLTALVVDLGLLYHTKRELQTAADAAALAAAWELPDVPSAEDTAFQYADFNDVQRSETDPTTPYESDATKIEVRCTRRVSLLFARIWQPTSDVSARAVARKSGWTGSALPFVNLDEADYVEDPQLLVWWRFETPGDFESIDNDEYTIFNPSDPATLYFDVHWEDGLELKKGNVATVKQEVGYIFQRHENVYLLSLRAEVIESGKVKLIDESDQPLNNLKNNDIVDPSQLVLLECTFDEFDPDGEDPALHLTVLGVFDIGGGVFPPVHVTLIE